MNNLMPSAPVGQEDDAKSNMRRALALADGDIEAERKANLRRALSVIANPPKETTWSETLSGTGRDAMSALVGIGRTLNEGAATIEMAGRAALQKSGAADLLGVDAWNAADYGPMRLMLDDKASEEAARVAAADRAARRSGTGGWVQQRTEELGTSLGAMAPLLVGGPGSVAAREATALTSSALPRATQVVDRVASKLPVWAGGGTTPVARAAMDINVASGLQSGSQAFQDTYAETKRKGLSDPVLRASLDALANAVSETGFGGMQGASGTLSFLRKIPAGQSIERFLTDAFGEGAAEGMTGLAQYASSQLARGEEVTADGLLEAGINSAVLGLAMPAAVQAGNKGAEVASDAIGALSDGIAMRRTINAGQRAGAQDLASMPQELPGTEPDIPDARPDLGSMRAAMLAQAQSDPVVQDTLAQPPQPATDRQMQTPDERADADRADFTAFLGQAGRTPEDYQAGSQRTEDVVPQPEGEPVAIGQSAIEGQGVMAQAESAAGQPLATAITADGQRTSVGRYLNHSANPNARLVLQNKALMAVPTRPIAAGEELTVDYRQAHAAMKQRDMAAKAPAQPAALLKTVRNGKGKALADPAPAGDWTAFPDALGVPRARMPQVQAKDRPELVEYLKGQGIRVNTETVDPASLRPTQAEYAPAKVAAAANIVAAERAAGKPVRPVMVSSDGYVIDGHHQWMAAKEAGEQVPVVRVGVPIAQAMTAIRDFPKVQSAGGAEGSAATANQRGGTPIKPAAAPGAQTATGSATAPASKGTTDAPPAPVAQTPVAGEQPALADTGDKPAATPAAPQDAPAEPASASGAVAGEATTIDVPGGQDLKARYEVRELDSLVPSHDYTSGKVTPNTAYPADLQPRDYAPGSAEDLKVQSFAQGQKSGYYVNTNPSAADGPPTITANGTVLNGNGRAMSLQLAARWGDMGWYRRELDRQAQTFGIDPDSYKGMRNPVLVRTVALDPTSPAAQRFARQGNVSATQAQSPARTAASLGGLVDQGVIDTLEIDDDTTFSEAVSGSAGRDFRQALAAALPAQEVPRYLNEQAGTLTEAGKELVRDLLLTKVLPVDMVERLREDRKGLLRGMEQGVMQMLRLDGVVPDSRVNGHLENALDWIARHPQVTAPAQLMDWMDGDGTAVQQDLTGKQDGLDPEARMLAEWLLATNNKPRQVKSGLTALIRGLENRSSPILNDKRTGGEIAADALGVAVAPGATFGVEQTAELQPSMRFRNADDTLTERTALHASLKKLMPGAPKAMFAPDGPFGMRIRSLSGNIVRVRVATAQDLDRQSRRQGEILTSENTNGWAEGDTIYLVPNGSGAYTFNHELVHVLENLGVLSKAEVARLYTIAKARIPRTAKSGEVSLASIERAYASENGEPMDQATRVREYAAHLIEMAAEGKIPPPKFVQRALDWLRDVAALLRLTTQSDNTLLRDTASGKVLERTPTGQSVTSDTAMARPFPPPRGSSETSWLLRNGVAATSVLRRIAAIPADIARKMGVSTKAEIVLQSGRQDPQGGGGFGLLHLETAEARKGVLRNLGMTIDQFLDQAGRMLRQAAIYKQGRDFVVVTPIEDAQGRRHKVVLTLRAQGDQLGVHSIGRVERGEKVTGEVVWSGEAIPPNGTRPANPPPKSLPQMAAGEDTRPGADTADSIGDDTYQGKPDLSRRLPSGNDAAQATPLGRVMTAPTDPVKLMGMTAEGRAALLADAKALVQLAKPKSRTNNKAGLLIKSLERIEAAIAASTPQDAPATPAPALATAPSLPPSPLPERPATMPTAEDVAESARLALLQSPWEQVVNAYRKHPDTHGGQEINADIFRDLVPAYNQSGATMARYAGATHEAVKVATEKYWQDMLARTDLPGRKAVVFLAGGAASGKGSSMTKAGLGAQRSGAQIVLDGTFSNYAKAKQKVEQALASGRSVEIYHIHRDVRKAVVGMINRAVVDKKWRTVPVETMVRDHVMAQQTTMKLAREFSGHPRVAIVLVDNNVDGQPAKIADLSLLEQENYVTVDPQGGNDVTATANRLIAEVTPDAKRLATNPDVAIGAEYMGSAEVSNGRPDDRSRDRPGVATGDGRGLQDGAEAGDGAGVEPALSRRIGPLNQGDGGQAGDMPNRYGVSKATLQTLQREAVKEDQKTGKRLAIRWDTAPLNGGEAISPSRVWEDGNPTDAVMNGTSSVDIQHLLRHYETKHAAFGKVAEYDGVPYLVRGDFIGKGVDAGEVLLANAEVVRSLEPTARFSRRIGRPDLANPGVPGPVRQLVDEVDEARNKAGEPQTRPDAQVEDEAERRFRADPNGERRQLLDKFKRGEFLNDVETRLAHHLINRDGLRAVINRTPDEMIAATKLIAQYRANGSEMARSFRSRMDRMASPEERKNLLVQAILTPPASVLEDVKRRYEAGDPAGAEALIKQHAIEAQKVLDVLKGQGIDPQDLTLPDKLTDPVTMAQTLRAISGLRKHTWGDVALEYWINSILSGPKTQIVNVAGNALSTGWDLTVQRWAEIAVGSLTQAEGKARAGELVPMYKALLGSLPQAFRNGFRSFQAEQDVFEWQVKGVPMPGDTTASKIEGENFAIQGVKGRIIRIPGRLLKAADSFWKTLIGHAQATAEAYRAGRDQKLEGPALDTFMASELSDYASGSWHRSLGYAQELTFQQDPKNKLMQGVGFVRNLEMGGIKPLAFVVPFTRTPWNIFATGLRKSPLGALALATRLGREGYRRSYNKGGTDPYTGREAVRHSAEQLLSWAIMMALAGMVDDDEEGRPLITGTGTPISGNKGQREMEQRGMPPLSIRIGDTWVSYGRLEPAAVAIGATVDMLKFVKEADRVDASVPARIGSMLARQVENKTFLSGISDIMNAVEDPDRFGTNYAANFAASWVPNIIRQPLREAQEYVPGKTLPQSEDEAGVALWLRQVRDKAIPIETWGPSPRVDVWGRDIERNPFQTSWLARMGEGLLNPAARREDRATDLDLVLKDWNDRNPEEAWWPTVPNAYFKKDKKRIDLTEEQYQKFLKLRGEAAVQRLGHITWSKDRPTEAWQLDQIKQALTVATRVAKAQVLREQVMLDGEQANREGR
jgi:hypothetical protein